MSPWQRAAHAASCCIAPHNRSPLPPLPNRTATAAARLLVPPRAAPPPPPLERPPLDAPPPLAVQRDGRRRHRHGAARRALQWPPPAEPVSAVGLLLRRHPLCSQTQQPTGLVPSTGRARRRRCRSVQARHRPRCVGAVRCACSRFGGTFRREIVLVAVRVGVWGRRSRRLPVANVLRIKNATATPPAARISATAITAISTVLFVPLRTIGLRVHRRIRRRNRREHRSRERRRETTTAADRENVVQCLLLVRARRSAWSERRRHRLDVDEPALVAAVRSCRSRAPGSDSFAAAGPPVPAIC